MKVIFDLSQVDALATLKKYAEDKGVTIDQIIDQALVKIALNLKIKQEENESSKEENNECSKEEIYRAKLDQYAINDFVKEKLKFKYLIQKDGTVKCIQFNKVKELNYSYDSGSGEAYIYLLKAGCPNKCDQKTLFGYSLMLSLKEIYEKIYGLDTYDKYVYKTIEKKIQESQMRWKMKNNGGK